MKKQKNPFFIFYDSRSGSTFLSNLLVERVEVTIPPETNFIIKILNNYKKKRIESISDLEYLLKIIENDSKFSDWRLGIKEIRENTKNKLPLSPRGFLLTIFSIYKKKHSSKFYFFGIKKGNYINNYKQIKNIFPNAKYICLIRDGRAVFNSKKNSIYSKTGEPFETNVYKAAKRWSYVVNLMLDLKKENPKQTLILYYENLINNKEKVLEKTYNFLEIKPRKKPNKENYIIPKRYGNIHDNIKKEADASIIDKWKKNLSKEEIYSFENIASEELKNHGYDFYSKKYSINLLKRIKIKVKSFLYIIFYP